MGTWVQLHIEGVNNIFLNQFGISGFLEIWITLDKLHWDILCISFCCFSCFKKQSPSTAAVIAATLWRLSHQNFFVDRKTSWHSPDACGWADKEWVFIFGWTYPLMKHSNAFVLLVTEYFYTVEILLLLLKCKTWELLPPLLQTTFAPVPLPHYMHTAVSVLSRVVFRTLRQPADSLQAPAVRAVHLEESWPAGEVEDGERRGRRLREASETKRVRPGTWENRVTNTQRFTHF